MTSREHRYNYKNDEAEVGEAGSFSWQRLLSRPSFNVRDRVPEVASNIMALFDINPIIAELLAARGHKADRELEEWLNTGFS
ncbi:MAG: hypothetical protein GYA55_12835, partial [SAR324 cluster bacterium]|nr:hypothetical protein [SAR324 cluster bacterium]